MEVIICIVVLVAWLLTLIGWIEFFWEVFISIIEREFNLRDTLMAFGFLTMLSVFILWLGIQAVS